jgi:hypothetical protein
MDLFAFTRLCTESKREEYIIHLLQLLFENVAQVIAAATKTKLSVNTL